jgi:glycosyltransferase involved in cell wall biosynthesis
VTDEIIHVSKERQQVYSYLHKPGVVIGSYPELSLFPLQCINRDRVSTGETPKQMIAIHSGALRSTYASDQLLEALILAAQSFPSLKFIVLGGIAGALKKGDLLETLKTSGILEFYEKVPFSEVVQKLQKSDIGINLVLPIDTAHLLAQPQKLYEYLAAGLPVVAADVPTIHRVLTEYNCGLLVDPHSPNEIAAAIVRLAEDANLREQMGLNARQAAEREFNWESQASRLCLVVESLLDKTTL